MVTIKVGKKRIKVFNCLLVLFILSLIIFIIVILIKSIIFYNVPSKFEYKDIYNNSVKLSFNNNIKSCDVKIVYTLDKNDVVKDELKDYKKKGSKYIKSSSYKEKCKKLIKEYQTNNKVEFKLNGDKKISLDLGTSFEDLKAMAKLNNKDNKYDVLGEVNTDKVGEYKLTYKLYVSKFRQEYLYRIVSITDTIKPTITLKGKSEIEVYKDEKFEEPGYTANDNYDGDITKNVKVSGKVDTKKTGEYELVYTVKDKSGNQEKITRIVKVKEKTQSVIKEEKDGLTYINNILIVNKKYGLPKDYDPGINSEASKALKLMQSDAQVLGLKLDLLSGYRSFKKQTELYNNYVKKNGKEKTDTFSAEPGHSEHQTGLAFDVGEINDNFGNTSSGKWLAQNCHLYGFIIRYPKGKQSITGYKYEPWHIRYLGVDVATKVYKSGLTLEEYLGIN